MREALDAEGIESIPTSSHTRLSKYHGVNPQDQAFKIFVVDQYDKRAKPIAIDECTEIFKRYEDERIVERVYVAPEHFVSAEKLISERQL